MLIINMSDIKLNRIYCNSAVYIKKKKAHRQWAKASGIEKKISNRHYIIFFQVSHSVHLVYVCIDKEESSCSDIVPLPAAAWCCSCCSPGPAEGCTSAGSQPRCESHPAPCSGAPPHARLFLPENSHHTRGSQTHQLNAAAFGVKDVFHSQWSSSCSSHSPSSSPSGSLAPLETPRSETSVCWCLPSGCWHLASPGPDAQKLALIFASQNSECTQTTV